MSGSDHPSLFADCTDAAAILALVRSCGFVPIRLMDRSFLPCGCEVGGKVLVALMGLGYGKACDAVDRFRWPEGWHIAPEPPWADVEHLPPLIGSSP